MIMLEEITQSYPNAAAPRDGLIYWMIRHYTKVNRPLEADRWWSYLSLHPKKPGYLKQFLKRGALVSRMDEFLIYHAVLWGMSIGLLHKVCALRCDEVGIRSYLPLSLILVSRSSVQVLKSQETFTKSLPTAIPSGLVNKT
jgi:hypothetical protein